MKRNNVVLRGLNAILSSWLIFTLLVPVHLIFLVADASASTSPRVTVTTELEIPRQGHTATVLADGRILIAGGENAGGRLTSIEVFNPADATFARAGSLVTARIGHSATLLDDGRVLFAGGRRSRVSLQTAEIYDPVTQTSQMIPGRKIKKKMVGAMTAARSGHTATKLADGVVLLAGGDAVGTAEIFDPVSATFTAAGKMAAARTGHSATLFADNSIFLAGGGNESGEFYDATSRTFTLIPQPMTTVRTSPDAVATADEKLLLFGGDIGNTVEQFDPASESFALVGTFDAPVESATLLANDNVLVLGADLAGVFAPAAVSNDWESLTDFASLQRTGHTTTELAHNKRLLIVGGRDSSNTLVKAAALFNPARVETDRDDYPPFSFVNITGSGFLPGETVSNQIVQVIGPAAGTAYEAWAAEADANGNFLTSWLVFGEELLFTTLDLTAVGQTSGLTTVTRFTDGTIGVTPASATISADTAGGTYTALTGPVIDEAENRDISTGTIILNAPTGFVFDTASAVSVAVSRLAGTAALLTLSSPNAVVTATTITITVSTQDSSSGNPKARARLTWSGIKVRPTAGTPLAVGNITYSGTASLSGLTPNSTSFGALTEIAGVATKLGFTTQPVNTTVGATLANVVAQIQDQFGNPVSQNGTALSLALNGGSGLSGTTTVNTDATGKSTFSALQINQVGTGRTLTASGGGYTAATSSSFNINAVTTSTTLGASPTATTYGQSVTFTATVTSGSGTPTGTVTFKDGATTLGTGTLNGSGVATFATTALTVGTHAALTAVYEGDGYYGTSTSSAATVTVSAKNLTVAGVTAADRTYDGTTTAVLDTTAAALVGVVGGDSVTLNTGSATGTFATKHIGTGKTVTIAGLTISGADASKYTLTQPTVTASITVRSITVTAAANSKTYDGATSAAATPTITSGSLAGGDTATWTETYDTKHVGTGKTLTPAGTVTDGNSGNNYTVTFATATTGAISTRSITVTAAANTKAYNGTTSAAATPTITSGSLAGGDTATWTETYDTKHVGTGKTLTPAGTVTDGNSGNNYAVTFATVSTGVITGVAVTISGVTANNKVYDTTTTATLNTGSAALVGVNGGDTVTLNTGSATGTFANKTVGTGKTVTASGFALTGADAGNYSLTQPTATANITVATVTGSITANNKAYDGNTTATIATRSLTGGLGSDVVTLTGGTATFADKNIGTGKTVTATGLTLTGADAGNYQLAATSATTTANITSKSLTVTGITAANKTYDGTTVATLNTGSAALVGVNGGDSVTLSTGSATGTFSSKTVGTGKAVTIAGLTLSGVDAGNYTLTQPATTANITARSLAVTATGQNKIYDATTTATVTLADNRVGGDVFTVSSTSATFSSKTVGTGKTISVSGISVSGTDAGNYTANATTTTTANITTKSLTITGTSASNKIYNGTTAATVNTGSAALSGVIGGDSVNLNSGSVTGTFDTKNIGTGKTVTVAGFSISATDASNYSLVQPTTSADITPRAITVTAAFNSKVYDGTTSAAAVPTVTSGTLQGTDTGSFTESYTTKNFGFSKTLVPTGTVNDGNGGANYTVAFVNNTTGVITAKALTVTGLTANNRSYDTTTAATLNTGSAALVGVVGGESVTLNTGSATGVFANKNVGTGKTVTISGLTISGADAVSYTLTQPTATANITQAPLTVTATGVNKVYNGTTAATVTLADNRLAGDVLTTSYTSAAFADKNVDTGKSVSVSGIAISGTDVGNYLANTTATTTANITAAIVTVTAANASMIFGGTVPTLTANYSGFVGGDTSSVLSGSPELSTTGTSGSPVGTYPITAALGTLSAVNYTFTFANGTLTIGNAGSTITITSSGTPSVYGQAVTFTATVTTGGGTPTGTVTFYRTNNQNNPLGTVSLNGAGVATLTISTLAAGTYPNLHAEYSGDANFGGNISADFRQVVNPAPLTITAADNTKVYGTANPTFTATYSGFVNGDTAAVLTTPVNLSTTATLGSNVGSYPITASGAVAANYSIGYVSGTLQITQATPAITWSNPADIEYGTALSGTQLNATANTAGSFLYNPAAGTVLITGNGQALNTTFTPTDSLNYTTASATAYLNVTKTSSSTSLASSVNPSVVGQTTALTATVTSGAGTPSGTVTFFDGATALGSATLAGGQATWNTAALTMGSHSITAVYNGDSNFNPSTSAILTQVVEGPPVVTTHPASQLVTSGNPASFNASATANPGATVQWEVSANGGASYTPVVGATSIPLALTVTTADNGKKFRAKFSNGIGTTASNPADLTVPAANISAQVTVTRGGMRIILPSQHYVQTVTIQNTSGAAIAGPLALALDNLSSNASLYNATGNTSATAPAGTPYVRVSPAGGSLSPNATVSVTLEFANSNGTGITYGTHVLGQGAP